MDNGEADRIQGLAEQVLPSNYPVTRGVIARWYQVQESLKNPILTRSLLKREMLERNAQPNITLSEKRKREYGTLGVTTVNNTKDGLPTFWETIGEHQRGDLSLWLDTPLGLVLNYRGCPNAVATFVPLTETTLRIEQLQGVRQHTGEWDRELGVRKTRGSRGLPVLQWEFLMIEVAESFARLLGFQTMGIRGARNNEYWSKAESAKMEDWPTKSDLQRRYDQTARESDYHRNGNYDWIKELS